MRLRIRASGSVVVATMIAFLLSSPDAQADVELCGSVASDLEELNIAIAEFIGESDCNLIEIGADIDIRRVDTSPEPISVIAIDPIDAPTTMTKDLTIDGKGFTLTGDPITSGFVVYLGSPEGSNTLTIRNLGMSGFGGSGALTVVSGTTVIERSMFTKNSFMAESVLPGTQDASAGAVNAYGRLSIKDSQFEENEGSNGGAVYSSPDLDTTPPQRGDPDSLIQISGSSFFRNTAVPGGSAVFSRQRLTMSNSTVTNNSGASLGVLNVVGSAFLDFCTIADNTSSGAGGGISATADITISNSIIYQNSPTDAYGYENITITSSLVTSQRSVESTLTAATLDDSNIIGEDPTLSPLGDYGGFTLPGGTTIQTRPPRVGSPVIDEIDLIAVGNGDDLTDQRGSGFPRIINGRADMGAVEYWPVVPDPPTDPSNPFIDFDDSSWSLNVEQQTRLPNTK